MQRFTVRWSGLPGGSAVNVVHSAGVGLSDAQGFADDLRNAYSTLALGFVEPATVQVDPLVTEINPANDEATAFFNVDTTPVAGGSLSEPLPGNIAMLLRFGTDEVRRGRRVQGRLFLPGLSEGVSVLGRPAPATRTDVEAAFSTLLNSGTTATLAVYSRPIDPDVPGAMSVATSVSTWEQWAQLGKRRS